MLKVNLHITPDVKEYTKGGQFIYVDGIDSVSLTKLCINSFKVCFCYSQLNTAIQDLKLFLKQLQFSIADNNKNLGSVSVFLVIQFLKNHCVQQSSSYNVTQLILEIKHYQVEGIHKENLIILLLPAKYSWVYFGL